VLEIRRCYKKRIALLKYANHPGKWFELCANIRVKLDNLLKNAPLGLKFEEPSTIPEIFDPAQAHFLTRVIRRVVTPVDVLEVTRILSADPAKISLDEAMLQLDLRTLLPSTVSKLFHHLRAKFPQEPFDFSGGSRWAFAH
jgi:hypothetical protein